MYKIRRSTLILYNIIFTSFILVICLFTYNINVTYNNMNIDLKSNVIKYGNKYSIKDLILKNNYKIRIIKDIDVKKVGGQQVVVELCKNNIKKVVPININIIDNTKPIISIKKDIINIKKGENLNLLHNVDYVVDDGEDIKYISNPSNSDRNYYTLESDFNADVPGEDKCNITAVDKANNISMANYTIVVKEPVVQYRVVSNPGENVHSKDLSQIAISLVGNSYGHRYGSYVFDCSGFVQYVYAQKGIHLPRGSRNQAKIGVGVSFDNAKPGDVISFGRGNSVSHSALYIGNGKMVHAANRRQGVVLSDVKRWERGSIDKIITIRRIV